MNKRFQFTLPKVSDALNGITAAKRHAASIHPSNFRNRNTNGKALFALSIVCFFWGTTWIASKQGVEYMPALQMAGLRQTIAGAVYVIYFLAKKTAWPKGKEWWPVMVLSFLNFVLSNGLSTWGLKYISAGLGSIIGAIFPLWLVAIALFGAKTEMKRKAVIGLALGFTGICVIFYQYLQDFFNADFRFGIFISLVSTWSWAFATLYTKKHAARFNPYFALGLQMIISGPLVYLISNVTNNAIPFIEIPWQSWAAIGYLVLFGSVISFVAYLYALQNLPTEQVSIYAYINPVVALLTGAILFNEKLTIAIAAGVCITLYGVRLVNKAAKS
ncbi:MAG: drug/metabolite-transporting permease [Flavisolibacter sp.]|jgi:drug/metabolite transporter (DMT)-like permease|nr:drug/metabolite-transporting permease [Flavisolibacter sp.]